MIEQTPFEIPRSAVKMLAEDTIKQLYSQYQQKKSWLEEVFASTRNKPERTTKAL